MTPEDYFAAMAAAAEVMGLSEDATVLDLLVATERHLDKLAAASEPEPLHDNEADGLKRCTDCGGSGWVEGFSSRSHCPTCDGSGWT